MGQTECEVHRVNIEGLLLRYLTNYLRNYFVGTGTGGWKRKTSAGDRLAAGQDVDRPKWKYQARLPGLLV